MINACQNVAEDYLSFYKDDITLGLKWGKEAVEEEHRRTSNQHKLLEFELLKLRKKTLLEIGWLITELKAARSAKPNIGYDQWRNIIFDYQNILLKINVLAYYCNFHPPTPASIAGLIDKISDYLCFAEMLVEKNSGNFPEMNEELVNLLNDKIVPLLENVRDLLLKCHE